LSDVITARLHRENSQQHQNYFWWAERLRRGLDRGQEQFWLAFSTIRWDFTAIASLFESPVVI
jgi:hypothetical protein